VDRPAGAGMVVWRCDLLTWLCRSAAQRQGLFTFKAVYKPQQVLSTSDDGKATHSWSCSLTTQALHQLHLTDAQVCQSHGLASATRGPSSGRPSELLQNQSRRMSQAARSRANVHAVCTM
jgi:hypothetical protein